MPRSVKIPHPVSKPVCVRACVRPSVCPSVTPYNSGTSNTHGNLSTPTPTKSTTAVLLVCLVFDEDK